MTERIMFGKYDLPLPQSIDDNFTNFVPSTERIHGMDGGFDNYGWATGPQEIGNVAISFILDTEDEDAMQGLIDDFTKLAAYGKQELRKWPHGATTTAFRFCLAKFNNIAISEDLQTGFDQYQRTLTVNFQVDDPKWYQRPANAAEWAYTGGLDNLVWNTGGSQVWNGYTFSPISILGYATSQAVGYAGNAPTPLCLTLYTGTAPQTLYNPIIQIEANGVVVCEVRWQGVLTNGEALIIDSKRRQLWLLSTTRPPDEEYQNFWSSSADWLMIPPTETEVFTLKVYTERSADRGTIYLSWLDAYYS